MADFYPAITGRWSGQRVRIGLIVDRHQESVPGRRPRLGIFYGDLLASSSLSGPGTGRVLDMGNIDLEEIANALADQTDYEHHWLINPDTGEIAFWTADTGIDGQTPVDLDELDLVVIDPLPSWVWYQDMADFADGIADEHVGRRLACAIQGKGAFGRFKDELHEEHPDLLPAWYAFRDTRARRRAVQWLADNSLIDDGSADRFLSEHPDPALP